MPNSSLTAVLVVSLAASSTTACGESDEPLPAAAPDRAPTALPCLAYTPGMNITADARLCAGDHGADLVAGQAAITIADDDVTLTCDPGAILDGHGHVGTVAAPTVGIRVVGRHGVTVSGCTARGFRYGVVVKDAEDVVLSGVHLDDNFTAPTAGWVQDTVQGGGVRFERVTRSRIEDSSLARNWNAVELRSSHEITVARNQADHCSNTGATLVDTHDSELADNDFSWAVRGGLTWPDQWYSIDTKDSAGIILDGGSSRNRILRNDTTFGGDGIFLRAVIGACATDNLVADNDTSFSPHNAIECWCDGNRFERNIASDSNYGLWLGGMDGGVVRENRVERSRVDGISIQIGEDRHTVIERNVITDSARVGLLLTGREYQEWEPLTRWDPELANSSHILVQDNEITSSGAFDLFSTSTRLLALAGNCNADGELVTSLGAETDGAVVVSGCGAAVDHTAPTATLDVPPTAQAGEPVTLVASATTTPADAAVTYVWLIEPARARFADGVLPPALYGSGPATRHILFPTAGRWEVSLLAHDGSLAAIAWAEIEITP